LKTSCLSEINSLISISDIKSLQKKLASKVITKNVLPAKILNVCGVDVSYKKNLAYGAAVIYNKNTKEIVEVAKSTTKITGPYIPGFFMLRETKPILSTLDKISKSFDILLIDGNGRLHPRRFGLACYIGLLLDKPTIGVAKSLLCGKVGRNNLIRKDGKIIGYQINKNNKKIYVSIGNKISLKSAVKIVVNLIEKGINPEPLRLANLYSKKKMSLSY
jgi:deoxyribonuclease V